MLGISYCAMGRTVRKYKACEIGIVKVAPQESDMESQNLLTCSIGISGHSLNRLEDQYKGNGTSSILLRKFL